MYLSKDLFKKCCFINLAMFVIPRLALLFHSRLQVILFIMACMYLDVSVANNGGYLCEFKP